MYTLFVLFVLYILPVYSATVCDSECMCNSVQSEQDIHGEDIDCSYRPHVLKTEYTLPNTVVSLDLSSNNLTRLQPWSLLRSKTMEELRLNRNKINAIEENVFELPELRRLDLSYNQLEVVDEDVFKNIKKLEYLNLANNRFTTFTKLTFHHLSNLNEIILDNNNIGPTLRNVNIFDRDGFGLTNKIVSLSISSVNLNVITDNFLIDAYDIRKLVISNNNLTETFLIPYTLEYLDMSDNPIKQIETEDFLDLPGLKTLKLNNLQIKEIPEYVFSPLHGLTHLELERNKNLTKFSRLAFGSEVLDDPDVSALETLSLAASKLTTLDGELIELFGQLTHLDLQGNPWTCDCKLVWLKKLQIDPNDYEHLRCAKPKPLYNSKIFELDAKYFRCPGSIHYTGIAVAGVVFCMILAVMALWLFHFLPKYQSRSNVIQSMYASSAAYTVLPTISDR